jgi:ABC-type sugar transport system ATPase subunit
MISHNLNDIFEVADRVAILHLGRMVASGPISEFDRERIVDFMAFGRSDRREHRDSSPDRAEQ